MAKNQKVISEENGLVRIDLRDEFPISAGAKSILRVAKGLVSNRLLNDMMESLRGLSDMMQLLVVVNIWRCLSDDELYTTGIKHIDNMLLSYYLLIKEEQTTKDF